MFSKLKVNSLGYKTSELSNKRTEEYSLPALTAGVENQGLNNYVPRNGATILKDVISISANGANTGATFYQPEEFTVLQDSYAVDYRYDDDLNENQYLFLTAAISKTIYGHFTWSNKAGWNRVKDETITLPIKNSEIDFEFMDSFVAELEAQRVAELEAYLSATGLKDYVLTEEEENAIRQFNELNWQLKDVTDIFDISNTKNILSKDIVSGSGVIPYLSAREGENSVSSYISYNDNFKEDGNSIFIGGKTFVVTYQKNDFFSNDSHNLNLHLKNNEERSKNSYLFLVACIKSSLGYKYYWGDSISNKKIKRDKILVPIKDGDIDYEFMKVLISAIQKLVIKDVVDWTDKKIAATKGVIDNDK